MSIRTHLILLIAVAAILGIALGSYQRHQGQRRNALDRELAQAAIAQARLSVAEDTLKTFITTCDLYLAAQAPLMQPDPEKGHADSDRALDLLANTAFTPLQQNQIESLQLCLSGFRNLLNDPIFQAKVTEHVSKSFPEEAKTHSVVQEVQFADQTPTNADTEQQATINTYEQLTIKMVDGFEELRERMEQDFQLLQSTADTAEARDARSFLISIAVFVLISIALLQWAQKQISAPIVRIATAAERAIANEHTYESGNHGSTEVQRLDKTLKDLINSLENMVTLRTSQLSEQTDTLKQEIKKRAAAETDLHQAIEAAEAASKAKSSFLAMMSHEIRTPMNGVVGFTDLLLDTQLQPQQREYGEAVKSSTANLLRILNDILDFSKIETGKLDFESIPFSLRTLIEESKALLISKAEAKGLEIRVKATSNFPSRLVGDPTRIRQILINLIGNAIKFTSEGKIEIEVNGAPVGADSHGPMNWRIDFSITDSGVGMSPDLQAELFNPFSQGDTSITRRFGGTGLGLAICKRLVNMMQGEIWLESEVDKGSTFSFYIQLPEAESLGTQPLS